MPIELVRAVAQCGLNERVPWREPVSDYGEGAPYRLVLNEEIPYPRGTWAHAIHFAQFPPAASGRPSAQTREATFCATRIKAGTDPFPGSLDDPNSERSMTSWKKPGAELDS